MIVRVQLNLEIDTDSRETKIVRQRTEDGLPSVCSAPGCRKILALGRLYCGKEC